MIFPADFVSQCVSRVPASLGDLELDALIEDHGVSWLAMDEMFALELATFRRCFPAHPLLSALHKYNRRKCAHLERDLAATVDLPPHSAFFSLQLLDLAHRWSEREDNDIHIFDVFPLAATVYLLVKMNPARAPDPPQPVRPVADLPTVIARLLARRQPHNAPPLHAAWTIQQIVSEEVSHPGSTQLRAWNIHASSLD